jgi:hypothetical protein
MASKPLSGAAKRRKKKDLQNVLNTKLFLIYDFVTLNKTIFSNISFITFNQF